MLKRLLHSPFESVSGAALLLSAATIVSRLVGIVRDHLLAGIYGSGPVLDAYYAAFKIPDRIEFINSFPYTPLGKVSKKVLRQMIAKKLIARTAT